MGDRGPGRPVRPVEANPFDEPAGCARGTVMPGEPIAATGGTTPMISKTLAIAFVALVTFAGVALVAPTASAQPCNTAGSCCGLTLCQCTLCGLPPLVASCNVTEGNAYASLTVSTCAGGVSSVSVCTSPKILMPVDPKSLPQLNGCAAETTVVLP